MTLLCTRCTPSSSTLSDTEYESAKWLTHHGFRVGVLPPAHEKFHSGEFSFSSRRTARADCRILERHTSRHALILETGEGIDVIDVDHRNGGGDTYTRLSHFIGEVLAVVETPSGSFHLYVPTTGHPSISVGGVDYLAGGRFVYLPGTLRPKYDGAGYRWIESPRLPRQAGEDLFPRALDALRLKREHSGSPMRRYRSVTPSVNPEVFGPRGLLATSYRTASGAREGARNRTLYAVACAFTKAVGSDPDALQRLREVLFAAARTNGLLADDGPVSVRMTISSGISAGLAMGEVA